MTNVYWKYTNECNEEQEAYHEALKILHSMSSDMLQSKNRLHSEALINAYRDKSLLVGRYNTRQRRIEAIKNTATLVYTPSNIPAIRNLSTATSEQPPLCEGQIQQQIWNSISAIKSKDNTTAAMLEAYERLILSLKYDKGHDALINL